MRSRASVVVGGLAMAAMLVAVPASQAQVEPAPGGADRSQEEALQVTITDGRYTDRDRAVAFRVEGCTADDVRAQSEALSTQTYNPVNDTLTARVADDTESGTYDVTFTCSDPQVSQTESYRFNEGSSPIPPPRITIDFTDGAFTDDDRRIAFIVRNCRSNVVSARSPIFSSSSYDRSLRVITARIEQGTRSGSYSLVVTCRGQPTLRTRARISASGSDDGDDDDGAFPRGGVDTGLGGTAAEATGSSGDSGAGTAIGWVLLAVAIPSLGYLVSSGRLRGGRGVA